VGRLVPAPAEEDAQSEASEWELQERKEWEEERRQEAEELGAHTKQPANDISARCVNTSRWTRPETPQIAARILSCNFCCSLG
jgi:hypothetical protein